MGNITLFLLLALPVGLFVGYGIPAISNNLMRRIAEHNDPARYRRYVLCILGLCFVSLITLMIHILKYET